MRKGREKKKKARRFNELLKAAVLLLSVGVSGAYE
jgi:hypothetical protein